nr:nucleotidyl transferase AbiEii/AbiGii toxin family protein [Desulforhopalus sp. IMCC35007]
MNSSANVAASVRQRLLNRARNDKRPFYELLQYYAMERFLYRLSESFFANHFILKGALLLRVWDSPEFRSTMDIDMLGKTSNKAAKILDLIRNILAMKVDDDGLIFDSDSLNTEPITEDADYQGIGSGSEVLWIQQELSYSLTSGSATSSIQDLKKPICQLCWSIQRRSCFVTVEKVP